MFEKITGIFYLVVATLFLICGVAYGTYDVMINMFLLFSYTIYLSLSAKEEFHLSKGFYNVYEKITGILCLIMGTFLLITVVVPGMYEFIIYVLMVYGYAIYLLLFKKYE